MKSGNKFSQFLRISYLLFHILSAVYKNNNCLPFVLSVLVKIFVSIITEMFRSEFL